MSDQFITEKELNAVKGLIHYLNEGVIGSSEMTVEAKLIDSNGQALGVIAFTEAGNYGLYFP